MVRREYKIGIQAGNPIANAIVVIVGILTIAVSVVLGFFAFMVLGAIVLVAAAVIGIRVWWLNYKLRRKGTVDQGKPGRGAPPGVIEGEYRVISRDRDKA